MTNEQVVVGATDIQRIWGAFVVNAASIRAIVQALRECLGKDAAVRIQAVTSIGAVRDSTNVDELLAFRNPRSEMIVSIIFSGKGAEGAALVAIDSMGRDAGSAFKCETIGSTAIRTALLPFIFAEARNTRAWFWWLRYAFDRGTGTLLRLPRKLWLSVYLLLAIGFVAWLVFVIRGMVNRHSWAMKAQSLLTEVDKAAREGQTLAGDTLPNVTELKHAVEQSTGSGMLISVLTLAAFAALGWFGPRFIAYLLPRVEFAIGEGEGRRTHRMWVLNCTCVTIVGSGILLPMLRARLF